MAKTRGAGPTPRVGRLLGSGSKGRSNNRNFKGGRQAPGSVNMLNPSQSGDPDVVQQRAAQATKGVMQMRQLRKNKSKGLGTGSK